VYGNEHYKLYDVEGHATMTIQQPTRNGCNPRHNDCLNDMRKPEELPYCNEYTGPDVGVNKSECIYTDFMDLVPSAKTPGHLFIPTRIDRIVQKRGCNMKRGDPGWCKRMWEDVEHHTNTYVAGIEDFTLMLVSNYVRKGIRGTSLTHKGFYYECQNTSSGKVLRTDPCLGELKIRPIDCLNDKCDFDFQEDPPASDTASVMELNASSTPLAGNLRGHSFHSREIFKRRETSVVELNTSSSHSSSRLQRHSTRSSVALQAEKTVPVQKRPNVYATQHGDIFTLSKILELAGLDLEAKMGFEETLRTRGTQVTIQVEYSNLRPLKSTFPRDKKSAHRDVRYIYRVLQLPINQEKSEVYAQKQPHDEDQRTIENRHGLSLSVQVMGSFGVFNVVYLMVMLTTSLALLGGARSFVDAISFYFPHQEQEKYLKARADVLAEPEELG